MLFRSDLVSLLRLGVIAQTWCYCFYLLSVLPLAVSVATCVLVCCACLTCVLLRHQPHPTMQSQPVAPALPDIMMHDKVTFEPLLLLLSRCHVSYTCYTHTVRVSRCYSVIYNYVSRFQHLSLSGWSPPDGGQVAASCTRALPFPGGLLLMT